MQIVLDQNQIQKRIEELAHQINRDYSDQGLMLVTVLNGAVPFAEDLKAYLKIPYQVTTLQIKSYIQGMDSCGAVTLLKDVDQKLVGQHVLVIEDIVDTGLSLDFIIKHLKNKNPQSLKICSLLLKPQVYSGKHSIDYVGFEIPDRFVVGYGMDFEEKYRELQQIYAYSPGLN